MFDFTSTLLIYFAWTEHFLNGYLTHTTLVWAQGRSAWQSLSSIPGLITGISRHDQEPQFSNTGQLNASLFFFFPYGNCDHQSHPMNYTRSYNFVSLLLQCPLLMTTTTTLRNGGSSLVKQKQIVTDLWRHQRVRKNSPMTMGLNTSGIVVLGLGFLRLVHGDIICLCFHLFMVSAKF